MKVFLYTLLYIAMLMIFYGIGILMSNLDVVVSLWIGLVIMLVSVNFILFMVLMEK